MSNQNKEITPKQELQRNLNWLYNHDIDKFYFIERLMTAAVEKEPISISMSLNEPTYIVKVKVGNYLYKDEFEKLEDAKVLIDMVETLKR